MRNRRIDYLRMLFKGIVKFGSRKGFNGFNDPVYIQFGGTNSSKRYAKVTWEVTQEFTFDGKKATRTGGKFYDKRVKWSDFCDAIGESPKHNHTLNSMIDEILGKEE